MRIYLTLGIVFLNLILMAQVSPPPPPPPGFVNPDEQEITGYGDRVKLPDRFLQLGDSDYYQVVFGVRDVAIYSKSQDKRLFPGLFSTVRYLGEYDGGKELFLVKKGPRTGIVTSYGEYLLPISNARLAVLPERRGFLLDSERGIFVYDAKGELLEDCNYQAANVAKEVGDYLFFYERADGITLLHAIYEAGKCEWIYLRWKIGRVVGTSDRKTFILATKGNSILFDENTNQEIGRVNGFEVFELLSKEYFVVKRDDEKAVANQAGELVVGYGRYRSLELLIPIVSEEPVAPLGIVATAEDSGLKSLYLPNGELFEREAERIVLINYPLPLVFVKQPDGIGRIVNIDSGEETENKYVGLKVSKIANQQYINAYKFVGVDLFDMEMNELFSSECGGISVESLYEKAYVKHYVSGGFMLLSTSFKLLSNAVYSNAINVSKYGSSRKILDRRIDQGKFEDEIQTYFLSTTGRIDCLLRDGRFMSLDKYLSGK